LNLHQIYPTAEEQTLLRYYFNNSLKISSNSDIIKVQNKVVSDIKSNDNEQFPIDIKYAIRYKSGLCYDRSMFLQKVMLLNDIKIRPVFLFSKKQNYTT
jgi:hypothetical protein